MEASWKALQEGLRETRTGCSQSGMHSDTRMDGPVCGRKDAGAPGDDQGPVASWQKRRRRQRGSSARQWYVAAATDQHADPQLARRKAGQQGRDAGQHKRPATRFVDRTCTVVAKARNDPYLMLSEYVASRLAHSSPVHGLEHIVADHLAGRAPHLIAVAVAPRCTFLAQKRNEKGKRVGG